MWWFDFFVLSILIHQQLETFSLHSSYPDFLKVYSVQKGEVLGGMEREGVSSRNTLNLLNILWFSPMLFKRQVEIYLDFSPS